MKGLDVCREYFNAYGLPMLRRDFPDLLAVSAVGLAGSGSECFGYDDGISKDHDLEPGFLVFLPDSVPEDRAFALERAYNKLPKEFMGLQRGLLAPVGMRRRGVVRASDFFKEKTGTPDCLLSLADWFSVPEYSLAEATNGEIFADPSGFFKEIRSRLVMPDDVMKKKLAGELIIMAQAGLYNYPRCLAHGERGAAALALSEYVESAVHVFFLLSQKFTPFYKWSFRALRDIPEYAVYADSLEYLLDAENGEKEAAVKKDVLEDLAAVVISAVCEKGLAAPKNELEKLAYAVNDGIKDESIRNKNILYAI